MESRADRHKDIKIPQNYMIKLVTGIQLLPKLEENLSSVTP